MPQRGRLYRAEGYGYGLQVVSDVNFGRSILHDSGGELVESRRQRMIQCQRLNDAASPAVAALNSN